MTTVTPLARHVLDTLRPIPNYPKPGIIFQDITPVLRDGRLFRTVVEAMAEPFREQDVTHVVGIEARGFILGGAVATSLGRGVRPGSEAGQAAVGAGGRGVRSGVRHRTPWSATGTACPRPPGC